MLTDDDFEELKYRVTTTFKNMNRNMNRNSFDKKAVDRTVDACLKYAKARGILPTKNQIRLWYLLLESANTRGTDILYPEGYRGRTRIKAI